MPLRASRGGFQINRALSARSRPTRPTRRRGVPGTNNQLAAGCTGIFEPPHMGPKIMVILGRPPGPRILAGFRCLIEGVQKYRCNRRHAGFTVGIRICDARAARGVRSMGEQQRRGEYRSARAKRGWRKDCGREKFKFWGPFFCSTVRVARTQGPTSLD